MAAPEATIAAAADTELTLCKQEPSIKLRDEEGMFSCPLTLWKFKERKHKCLTL
jgi:hypothetical protein